MPVVDTSVIRIGNLMFVGGVRLELNTFAARAIYCCEYKARKRLRAATGPRHFPSIRFYFRWQSLYERLCDEINVKNFASRVSRDDRGILTTDELLSYFYPLTPGFFSEKKAVLHVKKSFHIS